MSSKNLWGNIWYWRLAIFEVITDAFIAGAMVWMAAIANEDWSMLSPTARAVVKVSVAVAMVKVVKSFLSTTLQTLKDNQPPDTAQIVSDTSNPNVQSFTQSETKSKTVTIDKTLVPVVTEPLVDISTKPNDG